MATQDYTITLLIDQTPKEVFDAIKDVRGWWSGLYAEEIEGSTDKLDDEFTFRAGEGAHYSKQKLIELIPDEKVVWLVTESKLASLNDQNEWTGTKISFEIVNRDNKTAIVFTHLGLNHNIECFNSCSNAWSQYLYQRLLKLITKGKAQENSEKEI